MATDIDLNLDSLKIPNVTGTTVVADYGTKTADANTYLTAQQAINNLQLPYLRARSLYPARDTAYSIKNVRYNATLVFETPTADFTVDLPAGASNGHILHIVNKSDSNLTFTGATTGLDASDKSVPSGMATVLYQTSSGWMRISAGSLAHVVGTLSVNHGGTGRTSLTSNAVITGNAANAVNQIATANGAFYATAANGVPQFGTLPVAQGGTGAASHTANSIITGNAGSALGHISTAKGALYAIAANGAAQFGTLPVAEGGTGLTASPSMLTNLASTTAANVMAASPRPGVTGTLPIANGGTGRTTTANGAYYTTAANKTEVSIGTLPVAQGGTGLTASPSMLTDLSSTTAANVLAASPRPGVTGTLPVSRGGTGLTNSGYKNAVVIGNGTDKNAEFQTVRVASGAFYATGQDGSPDFGTLPLAQGGTGATTAAGALSNIGAAAASHEHAASAITSGTLGIARGGTGAASFGAGLVEHASATADALSIRSVVTTVGTDTTSTSIPTEGAVRTELNKKISVSVSGSTLVFS